MNVCSLLRTHQLTTMTRVTANDLKAGFQNSQPESIDMSVDSGSPIPVVSCLLPRHNKQERTSTDNQRQVMVSKQPASNLTQNSNANAPGSSQIRGVNSNQPGSQEKYLFKEGEKVLCYEPDPNKARVLYDSKIRECRPPKTKKSNAEYLVHFYGWNSSWDRVVSEENILKNSAENKSLQRQLAGEAAQGIKWKKVKLNKIPAIIKEVVLNNNSQDGESVDNEEDVLTDDANNPSSSSQELSSQQSTSSSSTDTSSNLNLVPPTPTSNCTLTETVGSMTEPLVWLPFPDSFKEVLNADHDRMAKKDWYNLPMKTTVTDILKDFSQTVERGDITDLLPNYNRRAGVTRAFTQTNSRSFADLQQLVDEFTNSLSIYFTSICGSHIFFNEEERTHFVMLRRTPCDSLGFVHLLRFLVVLPDFIQVTVTMSKKQVGLLMSILDNFYFFLKKRQDKYMIND